MFEHHLRRGGAALWEALYRRGGWRILLVLLFFFLSGACGLLYQVVWTRRLVLLLGAASYAVSTVLSVFFIGLGAGSLFGGRLADRTLRPLAWYGVFEILIGVWAAAFILLASRGEHVIGAVLGTVNHSYLIGILMRALLAGLFLLPPVVLMGATLPLLARFVSTRFASQGLRIGALYSLNTFGAVLGCAATGFWLLPSFGYTRSTFLGVGANVAIGLLALAVSSRMKPSESLVAEPENTEVKSGVNTLILLAYGITGFCALALEVLWTRLLTIIFLGTTYAFTTMLTALLCGIAVGSAVAALFADRTRRFAPLLFGIVTFLGGAACIGMLGVFAKLPAWLQEMQLDGGYKWDAIVQAKFILSFMVLFGPMFLLGMTFPFVVRTVASTGPRLGRDIGRLYSANTFGGVLGALAGGYLLIPYLGTHNGIIAMAFVLAATGMLVIMLAPALRLFTRVVLVLIAACAMAGIYQTAPTDIHEALNAGYLPKDHKVIHYREGIEGAVVVSESQNRASEESKASERVLWINAMQATASIEKGVRMNRFEGMLPMLFNRDPKTALFMCFGSGITAGTLGLFDFERIDAVELSKDVLNAATYFVADNFNVTSNPKFNFVVDDGRNFLLTTRNRYDLITFEPMPLAQAGVSAFYTREYYDLCREHLNPGGLVSQWAPLHGLSPEVVKSILYTFTTAFKDYCAFFINADLFLIGSDEPLRMDYEKLSARLAEPVVHQALQAASFGDDIEIVASFFMGKENIDAFARGGRFMTDDRPWAEFEAPKLVFMSTVDQSLKELKPYFESPVPWVDAGKGGATVVAEIAKRHEAKAQDLEGLEIYYGQMFNADPDSYFKKALSIDPRDSNAQYYLRELTRARVARYLGWKEYDNALKCVQDARVSSPNDLALLLALADIQYAMGTKDDARKTYQEYIRLGGQASQARERTQK